MLAALSRPANNMCAEALQVMDEVRGEVDANEEEYADGRGTILSIVAAAEEICASLATDGLPDLSVTPETT